MLRIAICDDIKVCRDTIISHISRYQKECNIELWYKEYDSGKRFLEELNKDYNVVFLDIRMPDLNGQEVAKIVREMDSRIEFVFMSSYEDGLYTGYEVGASNYIRKPVQYLQFKKELDKIISNYQREKGEFISIKNHTGIYKVYLKELKFIETEGRNICLHCEKRDIISYLKLHDLEKKLPHHQFFRSHASYIVNFKFVQGIERSGDRYDLILVTGELVPLSRARKKECQNLIGQYFMENL